MKTAWLLISIAAVALGGAMVVYGGYDDSPGGQLFGVVAIALGTIGALKSR